MDADRSRFSHFTNDQHKELKKTFEETGVEIQTVATDVANLPAPKVVEISGNLFFSPALPTSEPAAVGALWANNGVVTVGNGP